jgi:hypothetical protein
MPKCGDVNISQNMDAIDLVSSFEQGIVGL